MRAIKFVIMVLLLSGLGVKGFCVDVISNPSIDFGTANFLYGETGFNVISVSDAGAVTTSGSGNIISQNGGSAGTVTFGDFSWLETLLSTLYIETKSGPWTISTSECGEIQISDITTTNGATSTSKKISGSSLSFPIGAVLTLNSFTGSSACYIQGTVPDGITYRKLTTSATNVPLSVKVYVIPAMAIDHNTGASLNFGTVCSGTIQQALTIAPNGTTSGTTICPTQNTSADAFTVRGNIGQSFSVNLPNTATISNGSNDLTVSNFTSSCSGNCILTENTYSLNVGGTLTIPVGTPLGTYQGNYQVSITY